MSALPPRAARLEAILTEAFSPVLLRVVDDSARHAGHAGAQPGGETHYHIVVVSEAFRGLARIARSRAVHTAVATEFASGMHALSLELRTPEETPADPGRE
jgi:BolA protein